MGLSVAMKKMLEAAAMRRSHPPTPIDIAIAQNEESS
jgi:hypothetical protein